MKAIADFSIITLSREEESGGEEIGTQLSQRLGFRLVDHQLLTQILQENGYPFTSDVPLAEKERKVWIEAVWKVINRLADEGGVIFLGRGGQKIFHDSPRAFHLLVVAPIVFRLERIKQKFGQDQTVASLILTQYDRKRENFLRERFALSWKDPSWYHLVINAAQYPIDAACLLVEQAMGGAIPFTSQPRAPILRPGVDYLEQKVNFAHPSEEEFAQVLNFYGIRWLYEPRTFPLEWDSEGNILEAFSPDFYLPDFDLYLELTTQKQKLTHKKNRKVRQLQKLYPQVKIKVIYSRDFDHLFKKLGMEENG